jgi:hypothetical protein
MRCISCRSELEMAHVWVGSKTICPFFHAVMRVLPVAAARPACRKGGLGPILRLSLVALFLVVCAFLAWVGLP